MLHTVCSQNFYKISGANFEQDFKPKYLTKIWPIFMSKVSNKRQILQKMLHKILHDRCNTF